MNSVASPSRIILFCKVPVPGQVKTRLIPMLGANAAADLQTRLLVNICSELVQFPARGGAANIQVEIRFDGGTAEQMQALVGTQFDFSPQGKGNLGVRMARAVKRAFDDDITHVVVIGADIPELTGEILREALDALRHNDAVIGPTEDGGYYLLGLNACELALFENICWGGDHVFKETVHRLNARALKHHILPQLFDLDRPEDILRWRNIEAKKFQKPITE